MDFELSGEQQAWKKTVHEFAAEVIKPKAQQVDENEEFNWEAVRRGGEIGLMGMNIPEEYGGSNMDMVSCAVAMEELGWGCGSTALSFTAHNILGTGPIAVYGSEELKKTWLPRMSQGKGKLGSLALTEPDAGSDLQGGVTCKAEKRGNEWVVNGAKMWCTNAGIAEYVVTLVRTNPQGGSKSLSMILVPTDAEGLTIGPAEKKMGLRGSPAHGLSYENVRVPLDNLVGEEGRGLQQTLATLDSGRILIGGISVGLARAALEEALKYAQERKAFNQPIGNFQAIQFKLANMALEIELARNMVYKAAWLKDQRRPYGKEAAMAKLYASEMAERVCYDAIQIHGGNGYSRGYPVERMYRDARLMTIGEGTSEILRLVIARNVMAGG
ncbi:MAG: acyl-CoA dehydrogenase family protein [Chloroflexi bacterium]|nr:acyl-CoA dehydrogenase family protein [Chloroflexota bacterium]